jgi:hypothetical protein
MELRATMPFKRLKTRVLDLMDEHDILDDISHVVYMDMDIVVGGRLEDFFAYATQRMKRAQETYFNYKQQAGHGDGDAGSDANNTNSSYTKSFMLMFEEQGRGKERQMHGGGGGAEIENGFATTNTNGTVMSAVVVELASTPAAPIVWHGAVMMLHRHHSRKCLELWRDLFDTNDYPRDQSALYAMYHDLPHLRAQCEIVPMDHAAFLQMPTQLSMEQGRTAVFVHNTNTGRAKEIHKQVQYDFYRCAMLLDENLIKDDIVQMKRKKKSHFSRTKGGIEMEGVGIVQAATGARRRSRAGRKRQRQ